MIRLKELRKDKSQKDVAEYIGVTQQAYANYERGAREPDYATLVKLAEYFGVSTDYLLGNTDIPDSLDKQLEGIDFALYGEVKDLTEEEKKIILDFVKFTKSQRKDVD